MKKLINIFGIVALFTTMASCEDVIDINVPSEAPRLIVDALIRVDTTQTLTIVRVKVSQTNSFFGTIPPAGLQQITMSSLDNPPTGNESTVLLEEVPGSGIYSIEILTDQLIRDRYFLQIDFEDTFYVAESKFVPTVPIDNIEIGDGILFDENDIEIIVTFTDSKERDDYYLFDFDFANFLVSEDKFYQGQEFSFSYFYDEDLSPGDEIDVSIMGVDQSFFNYMHKIIEQSEGGFGIFETPSITVRGNIINATEIDNIENFDNTTTPNNFALGYFAIVQEFKQTVVIE
jgi:Domain of unknown function (DUF4249)